MNCEITPFLGPKAANGEGVCPVQIRGHRMRGVSGLSVARAAMGWVVVLVYIIYAAYLVGWVGIRVQKSSSSIGGKMSSFRRRAKYERNSSCDGHGDVEEVDFGGRRTSRERKDVESVVIVIDVEKACGR